LSWHVAVPDIDVQPAQLVGSSEMQPMPMPPLSPEAPSPPSQVTPTGYEHETNARPAVQEPGPASYRLAGQEHWPYVTGEPSAVVPVVTLAASAPESLAPESLEPESLRADALWLEEVQATARAPWIPIRAARRRSIRAMIPRQ